MRIRIVSRPIAPPWDSGSMNMAYGVGTHLGELEHEVRLPVVRGFHPDAPNVVAEPVFTNRRFGAGQKARLLRHLLSAPPAELLHFFMGTSRVSALVLTLIVKLRRTPSVLTLTHVPKPGKPPSVFGHRVVTYSAHLAGILKSSGIEQVVNIPPGVDERAVHPGVDGTGAGLAIGIAPGVPVALYGGEYRSRAMIDNMVAAISVSSARRSEMRFVLACRIRSRQDQLRRQQVVERLQGVPWGQRVILLEQVPDMQRLIARADVCILPLRHTYGKLDIPLFLLEAMAMAKPIVITDIPPMNELLQEAVGLGVPTDDAEKLADAIEQMVVDGRGCGMRGRQLVERRYSLRRIAKQYESLYAELLGESHPRPLS